MYGCETASGLVKAPIGDFVWRFTLHFWHPRQVTTHMDFGDHVEPDKALLDELDRDSFVGARQTM